MKKILLLLLVITSLENKAQPLTGQKLGRWDNQIYISDVSGRPVRSGYSDVSGFPFLFNEFKFGSIELINGRKFTEVPLRLDLVTHEVNFVSPNKEEGYLGGAAVKEVVFIDSTAAQPTTYLFRTNMPVIDNHKSGEFYQVLSSGKILLLKSITKRIDTRKNELSGEIFKEFVTYTDYYFYTNGKIERLKRDKAFISGIMADKPEKMENFLKNYRSSIKNEADLVRIFDHYNM